MIDYLRKHYSKDTTDCVCILSDKVEGPNDPLLKQAVKELGLTVDQIRWKIVYAPGPWGGEVTFIYLKEKL